jgi:hypothetical protein
MTVFLSQVLRPLSTKSGEVHIRHSLHFTFNRFTENSEEPYSPQADVAAGFLTFLDGGGGGLPGILNNPSGACQVREGPMRLLSIQARDLIAIVASSLLSGEGFPVPQDPVLVPLRPCG